jgi:hypothetical protein
MSREKPAAAANCSNELTFLVFCCSIRETFAHSARPVPTQEETMDPQARIEIEAGVQALDEALTGLLSFAMTLRPTLRNEIFQICGKHFDRAREAKERLERLLQD